MVKLNYQTNNPRWGWKGLRYSSWEDYAFCLGYLANIEHYKNRYYSGLIDLHVEGNHIQGAWGREGRIHYYGRLRFLEDNFPDWYDNSSAGNGSITRRINSNDYMYSLVYDYGFEVKSYAGYTTQDIFPPEEDAYDYVLDKMISSLPRSVEDIDAITEAFNSGWDLR